MVRPTYDRGGDGRGNGRIKARVSEGAGKGPEGARTCARRAHGGSAQAEMTFDIRRYRDSDHAAVRDLFVRVNRELATPALRDAFEAYIAVSVRDEIDRLAEYYSERQGAFFVVYDGE